MFQVKFLKSIKTTLVNQMMTMVLKQMKMERILQH